MSKNTQDLILSIRLPIQAIKLVDSLKDKVKKIKESRGDYSKTTRKDIMADCIFYGAPIFEEKLKEIKK